MPAQGVEVGGEHARGVQAAAGVQIVARFGEQLGVDLVLPEHLELGAGGVVVQAGEVQER